MTPLARVVVATRDTVVVLVMAAPVPPPIAPMAMSTPTWLQLTSPVRARCEPALMPPDSRAPPIIAAPIGPPTPVHMITTPPTIRAPAAMYSQLSDTQSVVAFHASPRLSTSPLPAVASR